MSSVELVNLSQQFGSFTAVKDVDVSVGEGEFVTFLGPSGCGKTTTLRMVAGLQQSTGGRISIGGMVVNDPSQHIFVPPEKRNIGMVFQSYAIWPHMTVFENVAFPLKVRGISKSHQAERVLSALRLVEMDHLADRPAPALSGGQQQRVAIARALVFEPRVLLLDEPLSNLDAKLRVQMGQEFRSLQTRLNITTIYVTHDQDEAMALSDRIVVMEGGEVLQVGSPKQVYRRPTHRMVAAFLGAPNFIEGRVSAIVRKSGEETEISASGTGWETRCFTSSPLGVGDGISIMIRPEEITFAGEGESRTGLTLHGRIAGATFHGGEQTVSVETHIGRLTVSVPGAADPQAGSEVTLFVPPRCIWAIPAS